MKTLSKKIGILAFSLILAVSASVISACGKPETPTVEVPKPSYTVTFKQNGNVKAEVTVPEGEKVDGKNISAPEQETISGQSGDLVTEWDYDFDTAVTKNLTVGTVSYTKGLTFKKSLKGSDYVIKGYSGEDSDVYMPDSFKGAAVTAIDAEAFKNNAELLSVRFPKNLTSIGDHAFSGCKNLSNVDIPETVVKLGANVFAECFSFTSFTFPPHITEVPARAIQGCAFTGRVDVPEGVKTIGAYAFACGAKSIVLPKSLRRIEDLALWYNLEEVYYAGGEADWETVRISEVEYTNRGITFSAKSITTEKATLYYYSETGPQNPELNYWHYVAGVPTPW